MACKLRCPYCFKVLKIQGDDGKVAEGEYVVIPKDDHNDIECLVCHYIGPVSEFDDVLSNFTVICDSSNNTDETISQNKLVVDILMRV